MKYCEWSTIKIVLQEPFFTKLKINIKHYLRWLSIHILNLIQWLEDEVVHEGLFDFQAADRRFALHPICAVNVAWTVPLA